MEAKYDDIEVIEDIGDGQYYLKFQGKSGVVKDLTQTEVEKFRKSLNKAPLVQEERNNQEEPATKDIPKKRARITNFTPFNTLDVKGKDPNTVYYWANKNMQGRVDHLRAEGREICRDPEILKSMTNIEHGSSIGNTIEVGDSILMEASPEWKASRDKLYGNKVTDLDQLKQEYNHKIGGYSVGDISLN